MALYCDDYCIVETAYIVHACAVDLDAEAPAHMRPEYLIGFILHVGHQGYQCSVTYPSRALRDAAFEALVALVKRDALELEEE